MGQKLFAILSRSNKVKVNSLSRTFAGISHEQAIISILLWYVFPHDWSAFESGKPKQTHLDEGGKLKEDKVDRLSGLIHS